MIKNAVLNTVYETVLTQSQGMAMYPTIIADDGIIDIYVSNAAAEPTGVGEMYFAETFDATTGKKKIQQITGMVKWMLFSQNSGTTALIQTSEVLR